MSGTRLFAHTKWLVRWYIVPGTKKACTRRFTPSHPAKQQLVPGPCGIRRTVVAPLRSRTCLGRGCVNRFDATWRVHAIVDFRVKVMRYASRVSSSIRFRRVACARRWKLCCVSCAFFFILLHLTSAWADAFLHLTSAWADAFSYRSTNILSIDFHISPVRDLKDLIARDPWLSRVHVIDESLSGHCGTVHTCATNLRVLNQSNGITLGACPNQLRKEFWDSYKEDSFLRNISAFVCHHSLPLCEVYMGFPQPMILIASTRYEIGRYDAISWEKLNRNLRAIISRPGNVLAANNMYDAEYLKHFTCIDHVPVIPNICEYVEATYKPKRFEYLIGPSRLSEGGKRVINGEGGLFDHLRRNAISHSNFSTIRTLYGHYTYSDIASHPGIILIPYQVSIMSLFEYYAMNIPLFVPSLDLLIKWQLEHRIMDELSWNCVFGNCDSPSNIPGCGYSDHPYDPNDVTNPESLRHWLKFADFYQWPGIVYFDDWGDLLSKLDTTNLSYVTSVMKRHWLKEKQNASRFWKDFFRSASSARHVGRRKVYKHTWETEVVKLYPQVPSASLLGC